MSFNFDFELPDFSKIDLTGLPSNLGPLGTSGISTMDSPPVNTGGGKGAPATAPATATTGAYTDVPYDQQWWSRVKLQENLSPEQMNQIYMEHGHPTQSATIGSFGGEAMPNPNFAPPGADPVTAAVDTATAATAITPESIAQYIGEIGPFAEGMDVNGDGEVTVSDAIYLQQIEQGQHLLLHMDHQLHMHHLPLGRILNLMFHIQHHRFKRVQEEWDGMDLIL